MADTAELSDEAKEMVVSFQNYQQQLQSILVQKESLKLQNAEISEALKELAATNQKNAYKITGSVMISKPVEEIKKELEELQESINIKIKSLEKNEERITNKLKELQTKLQEAVK
jgi:prefoldin beta subunit